MCSWQWLRTGLVALAVIAVCGMTAGTAHAGDEDAPDAATKSQQATVIITKDGTKTIRIVTGKDGRFVAVPADGADAAKVILRMAEAKDGVTHRIHGTYMKAQAGSSATPPTSPMPSVMKWMMKRHGDYAAGNDPVTAWFKGDDDVPLAGLRDILVADGWNAASLVEWVHADLSGMLAALLAPALGGSAHAAAPMPFASARRGMLGGVMPPHGRGHGMRSRGMNRGGMGPHGMPGAGHRARRGHCDHCGHCGTTRGSGAQSGAFVIWNDGNGWRTQELGGMPSQAHGARGMGHHPRGWGRRAPSSHHGRRSAAEGCGCNCPDCPNRGRQGHGMRRGGGATFQELLPQLRRVLERSGSGRQGAMIFPGGVRIEQQVEHEILEQDLGGLLESLGVLRPTAVGTSRKGGCGGDCSDCPKKGSKRCGTKARAQKRGCCGQCDGDCENCPNRGRCDGDCSNCPNKGDCSNCPNKGDCAGKAAARGK